MRELATRHRSIYRKAQPIIFVSGQNPSNQDLGIQAYGVSFNNLTSQWLNLGSGRFAGPTSRGTFGLNGDQQAQVQWGAPPGVTQPSAVASQIATLTYTEEPLPDAGGPILGTQVASQAVLERFAKAALPAAGNAGRMVQLTDYNRGVWIDTGTTWTPVDGGGFNVKNFGAIPDSGVTDNGVALRACITAARAAPFGARIIFPTGDGYYGYSGGLDVSGTIGLSFCGEGGRSNGSPVPSYLRPTDAIARCVDARNSEGFLIEDMAIINANAGFTGTVVDFTGANHWTISRSQILHTAQGIFVDASGSILWSINDSDFNGSAVTGASTGVLIGGASVTTARFRNVNFKCAGNFTPIRGATTVELDGLDIDGITLDGIGNATPAVALIDLSAATLVRGLKIDGLWSGDMGAGSTGAIVHAGLVRGFSMSGSFVAGAGNGSAQSGITTLANSDGIVIAGNEIFSLLVGLTIFTPVTDIDVTRNRNTAATPIAGYVPGGVTASPAVPASGVNATNNSGGYITVLVKANGAGAITDITVSASATGQAVVAGGNATVRVGPGQTISITYPGAAPTWTWFRD